MTIHRPHRIFLIDDHPVMILGMRALLASQGDLDVCGAAASARDAMRQLEAVAPDLAILDIGLGGVAGLDLIQDLKIHVPKLRMLCFSGHEEVFYAERTLKAGAVGYLMKTAGAASLLRAIRTVLAGQIYLSESMGRRILGRVAGAGAGQADLASPINRLSNRELQIIHHIGESRNNRQIARLTGVSIKTVEAHRSKIKDKLNLRSTTDLIRFATQWVQREDSFVDRA